MLNKQNSLQKKKRKSVRRREGTFIFIIKNRSEVTKTNLQAIHAMCWMSRTARLIPTKRFSAETSTTILSDRTQTSPWAWDGDNLVEKVISCGACVLSSSVHWLISDAQWEMTVLICLFHRRTTGVLLPAFERATTASWRGHSWWGVLT